MLVTCEVHYGTKVKLSGSKIKWYENFPVPPFAGDAVIKNQDKKHALLLHLGINKIDRAEAALKLVGESNRVRTDKDTFLYEIMFQSSGTYLQLPHHQSNESSLTFMRQLPMLLLKLTST
ncbi:hypothetical protein ACFE04_002839 [Oxalis oulophora]